VLGVIEETATSGAPSPAGVVRAGLPREEVMGIGKGQTVIEEVVLYSYQHFYTPEACMNARTSLFTLERVASASG